MQLINFLARISHFPQQFLASRLLNERASNGGEITLYQQVYGMVLSFACKTRLKL